MDSLLVIGLALLVGVPVLAAVAVRIVAAIPAWEPDPASGRAGPTPRLPWWIARSWWLATLILPLVSLSWAASPSLFWWSLAGPFTATQFGDVAIGESMLAAGVLLAMTAAHPVRPCPMTAGVSMVGVAVWFLLGVGYIGLSV